MEHDLNLTLKMYKSAFSDKQIIEIKKKMHIDPIFTYSDSEIALKVCRNKQRFKFNCRPLCVLKEKFDLFEKFPTVFGDPSLQNGVHCQKFVTNRDSLCAKGGHRERSRQWLQTG